MEENSKKITVKDIARIVGVSRGTVDRVLHKRGGVSKKSEKRILETIEELGYNPNIYASMLASNKRYHIYCIVPKMLKGEYWGLAKNGIDLATKENKLNNIFIHVLEFDQFDVNSFRKTSEELLTKEIHGVIIAPIYREETSLLVNQLRTRKIPFIYIDTKLDDDYLAYFGMPMYESGALVASLLTGDERPKEIVCIGIERGISIYDNATVQRKEGFIAYLAEHSPETIIHTEYITPYDELRNTQILDAFFKQHPEVRHVVTFNSRIYLIAEYLMRSEQKGYTLTGFDMLERNISALKKGYVRYLIAQHTETQLLLGINSLVSKLIFNATPKQRDTNMPMDIIIKENVDYYRDAQTASFL